MNDGFLPTGVVFLLVGILGSFLAGLLGIGGGVIYILALGWLLDGQASATDLPRFIVANSAAVIFLSTFYGFMLMLRRREVRLPEVAALVGGGIPGSLLTSYVILHFAFYDKKIFSLVFLAVVAAYFLLSLRRQSPADGATTGPLSLPLLVGIGMAGGVISAAVGLGGGMVIVPLLLLAGHVAPHRAASLSLGAVPFLALTVVLSYALSPSTPPQLMVGQWKYFLFPIIGALTVGSLLGMPWGMRVGKRISPGRFRVVFLAVILLVFIKMILL